eukprot:NODE_3601_length_401_cov_53.813869_g3551_i0.p1 GENE.NODE_3601_length_401_cov_53.813869_g3551_i0~~NODE_3601_length_401_cov_53.813869_g3551_i0.p1  ORF type:complete len:107 (+),score=5.77 NODE_3601_length_401_cov_53.813869_g3551_i0:78-398(+)
MTALHSLLANAPVHVSVADSQTSQGKKHDEFRGSVNETIARSFQVNRAGSLLVKALQLPSWVHHVDHHDCLIGIRDGERHKETRGSGSGTDNKKSSNSTTHPCTLR